MSVSVDGWGAYVREQLFEVHSCCVSSRDATCVTGRLLPSLLYGMLSLLYCPVEFDCAVF